MLNPVHLRTLNAVLETGSFAAAAKQLGYSPSAVSQQVSALESAFEVKLFERSAHSVQPTRAALTLSARAVGVLSSIDAFEHDVRAMAGGRWGTLHIGSFPTASKRLVPGVLARIAHKLPSLSVVLDEAEPDSLLPRVSDRRLDVGIVYEYGLVPRRWPRDLQRRVLLRERLILLIPRRHRLVGASGLDDDFSDETWISTRAGTAGEQALSRVCAASGFVPRVNYRSNDYDVVRKLVQSGLGLAVIPALGHEAVDDVHAVALDVPGRAVVATWRAVGAHPAVDAWVDACRRVALKCIDDDTILSPDP